MRKRTIKNLKIFNKNPFLIDAENAMGLKACSKSVKVSKEMMDIETNEIFEIPINTSESQYYWEDKGSYTKLFKEFGVNCPDFNSYGTKLLFLIFQKLQANSDTVIVTLANFLEYTQTTVKTDYYEAINNLVDNKIIALSEVTGAFYINPKFIFNGKREKILGNPQQKYLEKYMK